MHVSSQVYESHAELTESDMSEFWVRNEVGNSMVTLATRNMNTVVYFMLCFQ